MAQVAASSAAHRCGMSLREHVGNLLLAMMMAGLGGGCEGTYEALVEVAEFLKRDHNFPSYEPTLTEELLADAAQAKMQEAEDAFSQMTGGKVPEV